MTTEEYAEIRRIAGLSFAELTSDQKIERLRQQLMQFDYVKNQVYQLENKIRKMENHSHQDGKIVVPFNGYSGGLGELGAVNANFLNNKHSLA